MVRITRKVVAVALAGVLLLGTLSGAASAKPRGNGHGPGWCRHHPTLC